MKYLDRLKALETPRMGTDKTDKRRLVRFVGHLPASEVKNTNSVSYGSPPRDEKSGWDREDWQAYYTERAAIAEYDGGLLRPQAEVLALACCITQLLDRGPPKTRNNLCAGCGGLEAAGDPLLPYGGGAAA